MPPNTTPWDRRKRYTGFQHPYVCHTPGYYTIFQSCDSWDISSCHLALIDRFRHKTFVTKVTTTRLLLSVLVDKAHILSHATFYQGLPQCLHSPSKGGFLCCNSRYHWWTESFHLKRWTVMMNHELHDECIIHTAKESLYKLQYSPDFLLQFVERD